MRGCDVSNANACGELPLEMAGPHVEAAILAYLRQARTSRDVQRAHLAGAGAIAELEGKLRAHYGKRFALCVANATLALTALGMALDLSGSDVIIPDLFWGGSIAGLRAIGAHLCTARTDHDSMTLRPGRAHEALTSNTRAVLAIDMCGNPADHVALRAFADAHGLVYVHDAAQSFGGTSNGRAAGACADAIVTSFTSGKTLWAGEGGAILTDDAALYERLVLLTQHPDRQKRDVGLSAATDMALNFRMHPLSAVWANADFEPALQRLAAYQIEAVEMFQALNTSKLTMAAWTGNGLQRPTFFATAARWRRQTAFPSLCAHMERAGWHIWETPLSISHTGPTPEALARRFGIRFMRLAVCDEISNQCVDHSARGLLV